MATKYLSDDEVFGSSASYISDDEVFGRAEPPAPPRERTWGQALSDTGAQLAEGVNTILGAVPNLVAPDSSAAQFFSRGSEYWREAQSDPLKQRIQAASQAIDTAGQDGVIAQIVEASKQYFTDPALAARFVTTNLPSMIPGIGAAKVAQAASLARGASAAQAASAATTAAGATGAVLNAGGARGEAFEDIKRTLMKQGLSEEEATQQALRDSRVSAAVGALAGFVSGKTGLERAIVGRTPGAAGATRAFTGGLVKEAGGEQLEEVSPLLTTNLLASQYDDRSVTQNLGRTMVETAIGSGPGSLLSGGMDALSARRPLETPTPPPPGALAQLDAATQDLTQAATDYLKPSDIVRSTTVDEAVDKAATLAAAPLPSPTLDERILAAEAPGLMARQLEIQRAVDREAELLEQRDGTPANPTPDRLRLDAQRREEAAGLIESNPRATPDILARAALLRSEAQSMRARADEIAATSAATAQPAAGTQFEREQLDAQAAVNREMRMPARETPAAKYADLTPMTPMQARQRLVVMQDQSGAPLSLEITPHPTQKGAFAIARRELPTAADLDIAAPAPAPVSAAEAQNRIESAELGGREQRRKRLDEGRQIVVTRALKNVEERGGVASPQEAQIFQEAGLGRPYDSIDASLGPKPGLVLPQMEERGPATTGGIVTDSGAPVQRRDRQERGFGVNAALDFAPTGLQATTSLGAAPDSTVEGVEPTGLVRALDEPSNGRVVTSGAKMSTARPAAPGGKGTIDDNGTKHTYTVVDPGKLGAPGRMLSQVARIFGKKLVVFESDTMQADGFVLDDDNSSVYLNSKSSVSPLAVFGHEMLHLLKRDNPQAYAALEAVVQRNLDAEGMAKFKSDYGQGATLEELAADLTGNRFQDPDFWTDVFNEIAAQNPEGARGVILKLAAALNKAVNAFKRAVTGQGFKADQYVKDLDAVKAAVKAAVTQYAQQQREPAMRMEAELMRAESQTNLTAGSSSPAADSAAVAAKAAPASVEDELAEVEAQTARFSAARRGGTVEQAGDFQVRTQKDGTLGVAGDVEAIRALLPENVRGRAVPGGLVFTTSDAPRVRAALEGRKVAYSRGGQVFDKLPMKGGKYVGAPEKYNTPGKITALRKSLRKLALEGEPGRFWYENSSREVLAMTGGNVQEARKLVALLSIYSPQAKVDANSTFGLRAWAQYKAGQQISVKTGVQDEKARRAMEDVDAFWSGEKTGNFFFNLLREIDPSTAGKQGATIDMWMMRAGEYKNDAPTATQYAFMENETNRLAQELGWEPQQVQAAIWVAMKARMENAGVKKRTEASSEKKGWIRYDYPLKNGRPRKTRVIINAQAHRDNWLKHAFEHNPSKSDTQGAKFDFSDGLRRHIGQLSWEARPGRSTNVLPGVNDAPYEQQVEFQQAMQRALLDDDGVDLLAYKLGLLVDGPDILAPGIWQGEVAAGMQKLVGMAPAKGDAGKTSIDPAQKQAVETYASMLGLLLRQEGVGYHRPFYAGKKSAENGVDVNIGRAFSPAEAQEMWGALDARMRATGIEDWESGAGMISSPTGMRVVNFGALQDNAKFRALVQQAAGTLSVDEVKVGAFSTDGDLVMNDWKENPNGEGYRSRIAAAGSPDLLDWARDVLAPRVQSVFNEFSSKYGWGNPGDVDSLFQERAAEAAEEVTPAEPSPAPEASLSRTRQRAAAEIPLAELRGRQVSMPVRVEDTGETGTLTMDAGDSLADINEREAAMQRLLECLRK